MDVVVDAYMFHAFRANGRRVLSVVRSACVRGCGFVPLAANPMYARLEYGRVGEYVAGGWNGDAGRADGVAWMLLRYGERIGTRPRRYPDL